MIPISEIKRMIGDLEEYLDKMLPPKYRTDYQEGLYEAYTEVKIRLKELIPSETINPNRTDGNGPDHSRHDKTDQV